MSNRIENNRRSYTITSFDLKKMSSVMNKKRNNAEQKQINPTNLRTVTLIMLSLLSSIPHVTPWSLLSPSQHICTKSTRSTFTLTSSSSLSRMLSIRRQQFTPSSSSQIILQQQSQASSSSTSSLETENSSLRDMIKQLEEENENLKKIQHQQQEIQEKQSTAKRNNNNSNNNNKKIILETFEGEHMFDSLPNNNTNNMMMDMDGDNDDDELWCDSLDGDTCPLEPTLSFGEALRDRAVWLVGTFCS